VFLWISIESYSKVLFSSLCFPLISADQNPS
jgi:hypothetical protein